MVEVRLFQEISALWAHAIGRLGAVCVLERASLLGFPFKSTIAWLKVGPLNVLKR